MGVIKSCKNCEKEFTVSRKHKCHCSKECRDAYYKEYKKKHSSEWSKNNREKMNILKLSYRMRLKHEVLSHYSGGVPVCCGCGERDVDVLELDHINDNGAKDRKTLGISSRSNPGGSNSYEIYRKYGYPDDLQVLCCNCNRKKEILRRREHHKLNPEYKSYITDDERLSWIVE